MSQPPATASNADHPGTPFLDTRRMRLSGLRHADLFDLVRLGRDLRVTRALVDAPVSDLHAAAALVDDANRIYREKPGYGLWRAGDRSGRFLGFFSLVCELDPAVVEIGVRLLPSAWGRGYALEGGEALCRHAFDTLGLARIEGLCAPENRSVPPLLARLGFVPDGEVEQFGNRARRFALVRCDWRGIRRRVRGDA